MTPPVLRPQRNKHCLHRGDLHHGAPADLAAEPVPHDSKRITIITSWVRALPWSPHTAMPSQGRG